MPAGGRRRSALRARARFKAARRLPTHRIGRRTAPRTEHAGTAIAYVRPCLIRVPLAHPAGGVAVAAAHAGSSPGPVERLRQRRYVGGAFITLKREMRERLWARVRANAKPVKGVQARPAKVGTSWAASARLLCNLADAASVRRCGLSSIAVARKDPTLCFVNCVCARPIEILHRTKRRSRPSTQNAGRSRGRQLVIGARCCKPISAAGLCRGEDEHRVPTATRYQRTLN